MSKKLSLENLKVKSFVTEFNETKNSTILGGDGRIPGSHATNCVTLNDDTCSQGGGGVGSAGWCPSQGCTNNSCGICYAE